MSLTLVPFENLGVVSFSPSIVTVAISVAMCEIFSVKEWCDLENQVRGRSKSLKMAPFDRPHVTFYWSAIVNIPLSLSLKMAPFDRPHATFYWSAIVNNSSILYHLRVI